MAPTSRLGRQITEVIATLNAVAVRFALIGGLALASHRVVRATQDVDLLVDLDDAETVDEEFLRLGYRCLHRTTDAGNYLRGDERIDLLYASRPIARRLLSAAPDRNTALGKMRVISAEGLIGFKLQGIVNNPRRTQDLEDIRALLRANQDVLDMEEIGSISAYSTRSSFSMSSSSNSDEPAFVAEGGLAYEQTSSSDPFQDLDELMVVVEALYATWPQRPLFQASGLYLL